MKWKTLIWKNALTCLTSIIPSIDRWFEIKGQPLTVSEVQKCEQFCRRKDNENIKFSILIVAPKPLMLEEEDFSILGIREYTWQ